MDFLAALVKKKVPASAGRAETRAGSLRREGPLEEGMATRCSVLAWKISWTEEPGGLESMMLQGSDTTD